MLLTKLNGGFSIFIVFNTIDGRKINYKTHSGLNIKAPIVVYSEVILKAYRKSEINGIIFLFDTSV